jgi:hypothetical protein
MHNIDIINCYDPLPIPKDLKFLKVDWKLEPYKTNCLSGKFEKYLIFKKKLYKEIDGFYSEIPYSGFITFYTHFFNEPPTKQIYVSYIAEFEKGRLNLILLNDFKVYDLKKESMKINYLLTIFNLFKNCYLKKIV